jgi:hypothetical protein
LLLRVIRRPPSSADVNLHREVFALFGVFLLVLDVLSVGVLGVVPRSDFVVETVRVKHSLVDRNLFVDVLQTVNRLGVLVRHDVVELQHAYVPTSQRLFDRCGEYRGLFVRRGTGGGLVLVTFTVILRDAMLGEEDLKETRRSVRHESGLNDLLGNEKSDRSVPTLGQCKVSFDFCYEISCEVQNSGQHEDGHFRKADDPLNAVGHVDGGLESASGYEEEAFFLVDVLSCEFFERADSRVLANEEVVTDFLVRVVNLSVGPDVLFCGDVFVLFEKLAKEEQIGLG